MAIISTETKASAASPGNNKGLSFSLSNQWETYQGLEEDVNAWLIKAEQSITKFPLCTDFLPASQSLHENAQCIHAPYIPKLMYHFMFHRNSCLLLFLIIGFPYVYHMHNKTTVNSW